MLLTVHSAQVLDKRFASHKEHVVDAACKHYGITQGVLNKWRMAAKSIEAVLGQLTQEAKSFHW